MANYRSKGIDMDILESVGSVVVISGFIIGLAFAEYILKPLTGG